MVMNQERPETGNEAPQEVPRVTPGRIVLWVILLAAIFLLAIYLYAAYSSHLTMVNKSHRAEHRARSMLRSIGSGELAYNNRYGIYGSFQALKDELFIAEQYTPGNMIELYTLTWEVTSLSTVSVENAFGGSTPFTIALPPPDIRKRMIVSHSIKWALTGEQVHRFEVIAWPHGPYSEGLHTFGITEDQTIRVYSPSVLNQLEDVKTWDPIL